MEQLNSTRLNFDDNYMSTACSILKSRVWHPISSAKACTIFDLGITKVESISTISQLSQTTSMAKIHIVICASKLKKKTKKLFRSYPDSNRGYLDIQTYENQNQM